MFLKQLLKYVINSRQHDYEHEPRVILTNLTGETIGNGHNKTEKYFLL